MCFDSVHFFQKECFFFKKKNCFQIQNDIFKRYYGLTMFDSEEKKLIEKNFWCHSWRMNLNRTIEPHSDLYFPIELLLLE